MAMPTVLISGAGIAGASLAFLLGERGFRVTVVERSAGQRSSGTPVDVVGAAFDVAARMGVVDALRAAATRVRRMTLLDARGRRTTVMFPVNSARHIEVPRADLARILGDAAQAHAIVRYNDTITRLDPYPDGVDVWFQHGAQARFDYVIGCDGLHSIVRRLMFGPEARFTEQLGMYIATFPLGSAAALESADEIILYNEPDRAISIHPSAGAPVAAFMFRAHGTDAGDPRGFISATYRGVGWRAPELLAQLEAADDVYFDAVTRVRMPRWSKGRVAVLGDAASCVSFLGSGSSNAMAGAAQLADALAESPANPTRAFGEYERGHRKDIDAKLRGFRLSAHVLIPSTGLGIAARNAAASLWSRRQSMADAGAE